MKEQTLSDKINGVVDRKTGLLVATTIRTKYVKEFIKKLKDVLIRRICCPNKPVNTFQNAREHREIIKEEIYNIFGDKLVEKK